MREFVKDGTVTAFALWNPADLGYLAAYAAQALVDGQITGEEGDTFKAGKLGDVHGRRRRRACCSATRTAFNADNIDDFDF